jgi:hypothetical protein
MQNEPAAAIGCRQNRLLLISDNVRVAMMLRRMIGISPPIADAERQDGRERDDGSHQHSSYPFKRFR